MSLKATVTNIAKGSLHDGPGVRSVVYLKGCGLRCRWCHNPETLGAMPEVLYAEVKCIHCGRCIEVCPEHHIIKDGKMVLNRTDCKKCGKCTDACPTGALSMCGEEMTAEEVFDEIKKDAHFYTQSGGGITLSGGECLLNADFSAELLKKCKSSEIHTAVETALFVPWENVEKVLPFVDLFFADFKIPDAKRHKEYTGQDNKLIIENIKKLSKVGKEMIIRIPLIPGVNDSLEDMKAFGESIKEFGDGIKAVELLKYNYLAVSKYEQCGREYTDFGNEAQSEEKLKELSDALKNSMSDKCDVVFV